MSCWYTCSGVIEKIDGQALDRTLDHAKLLNRKAGKLVVEGVNRVYKHVKRSQKNPQGGRLSKEMPIAASNVLLVCEKCGSATRLGVRYLPNGTKERYCKKCGAGNGHVSPPKARYAKRT